MNLSSQIEAYMARTASTPLSLYIADFVRACEVGSGMPRPLSEYTCRGYRRTLEHLDKLMGSPALSGFNEEAVSSVVSQKRRSSQSFARLIAATAKAFSTWLHRKKFTETNRLEDMGVPSFNARRHAFSDAEFKRVLTSLPELDSRNRRRTLAMILLAAGSGLRSNEMRNLALRDVHIAKPLADSWALVRWDTTKTKRERMVCISEEAAYAIHEYIASDRPQTDDSAPLFISEEGRAFSYEGWRKSWYRVERQLEAMGVKDFMPHRLRHQWATMAARSGQWTQAMLEQQGGWERGSKVPSLYIDEIPFEEMQKRGSPMTTFLRRVV